ncbi:hypothetical protein YT03_003524 [Salmonella enterica subsp. enterica]|nr:hypothetical protein [Salmonella enterica subsp. enterica serovar Sandiego]
MTPLRRGGTDYFYKNHCIISGALLASRCLFSPGTPWGAASGAVLSIYLNRVFKIESYCRKIKETVYG